MRISDLQHAALQEAFNICLSKVTLAINAGGAATIKTTGTSTFINKGLALTKAALSNVALATVAAIQKDITGQEAYYIQPKSSTAYYLVCLDSSGNVKTFQGLDSTAAAVPYVNGKGAGDIPSKITADYTPIGCIKIVTDASTTFTPATTALDAAGLTVTFTDLALVPGTNP